MSHFNQILHEIIQQFCFIEQRTRNSNFKIQNKMTPAQNATTKVVVNFAAVVVAVWIADASMTAFKTWRAKQAAAKTGGNGAPPAPAK